MLKSIILACLVAGSPLIGGVASAQSPNGDVRQTFSQPIPNAPGKSLIAVEVSYPPDGATPAHRHAPSAFIYARVLSGRIESQVDDQPARVYGVGESFYEEPGSHHRISRNASATEPATLLAIFIADTGSAPLTILDTR